MTAIPFLLFDGSLFGVIDTGIWGTWLIWASAVLTVWSMVYYLQKALQRSGSACTESMQMMKLLGYRDTFH
jgi:phosphatidylglycerophosphate synthase